MTNRKKKKAGEKQKKRSKREELFIDGNWKLSEGELESKCPDSNYLQQEVGETASKHILSMYSSKG